MPRRVALIYGILADYSYRQILEIVIKNNIAVVVKIF